MNIKELTDKVDKINVKVLLASGAIMLVTLLAAIASIYAAFQPHVK